MKKYAFGIDIGGTTVKMGLFSIEGDLIKKWEIPTRKDNGGCYILHDIAESVEQELKNQGIDKTEIEGIGIDVPGPVLEDRLVNKCANLGWGVLDVASETRRLTGIKKVMVTNDANSATLGEMWKGGGQGHKNLVMLTLGTGIGGGIVHDGKIISGAFGAAGEIGHICVNKEETFVCGCGKKGHLEQYASATGIVRKAQQVLDESDKPSMLRNETYLSCKAVFDCAKKGDELSLQILDFVGEQLGNACAMISAVFDPEVYVIGGGVSKAGDMLIDLIREHYKKYAFHASVNTDFVLATLGNDAGMYGAVRMLL